MKGKKTGGRQKGSLNEKTKQWEHLGEAIKTTHADRLNAILDSCDDDTFIKHYSSILEYFQPKLARTEIKGEVEIGIKTLIIEPASKDKNK